MKMENELAQKTINGMMWKALEKISSQGMLMVIQIVLARLILPEEYGLVGLLTIFISISDIFVLQGLTTALIQKQDSDDIDFSSVFIANVFISLLLYAVLYFIAPYVAVFYRIPSLTRIMRVLSLNVVFGAFSAVHNAILSRNLDFRKSFWGNTANVTMQGIVGITLALLGYGAWAIVFSKLAGMIAGVIVLWVMIEWKPQMQFSFLRVKQLFSFSSKILCTNLLNTVFNNLHALVIGRYYSASDVGFYQRGQQIPQAMMSVVDGSMAEVLYPSFSKMQDDLTALKKALRKSISVSMYVSLPMMFGAIAIAESFTRVLLTEKWLPSVPFMQLSCIICMLWPLSHRTHALNAMGLSGITLKLSLIGKTITLICIVISLRMGVYALMLGTLLASFITFWITSYFVKKYTGYKKRELAFDVLPSLLMSAVMCFIVLCIGKIEMNQVLLLLVQTVAGIVIYILLSALLKPEPYKWVLEQIVVRMRGER